jgi:deoxycytidylate deaminase
LCGFITHVHQSRDAATSTTTTTTTTSTTPAATTLSAVEPPTTSSSTPAARTSVGGTVRKREDYISWDDYFMGVAFLSAMRSKDPSTQVGACLVDGENKIVGIGAFLFYLCFFFLGLNYSANGWM